MSDLRFFSDIMHEALNSARQLEKVRENALRYEEECRRLRDASRPRLLSGVSPQFHKATEGMCAVRIILGQSS